MTCFSVGFAKKTVKKVVYKKVFYKFTSGPHLLHYVKNVAPTYTSSFTV